MSIVAIVIAVLLFAKSVVITVSIAVPVMIMFNAAPGAIPIALIELPVLITGGVPLRSVIGTARPIAIVPSPSISLGVPITLDPCVTRPRSGWNDARNARLGRRTNTNG